MLTREQICIEPFWRSIMLRCFIIYLSISAISYAASLFGNDDAAPNQIGLGVRTVPNIKRPSPVIVDNFADFNNYTRYGSNLTYTNIATRYVIEDCEDVWTASTNVTGTLNTTNHLVGSGCVQFTVADAFTTGLIAFEYQNNNAFVDYQYIDLYVYTSIALNAGDLQLLLDDTNGCVSPVATIDFPALSAAKWTQVRLVIPDPSLMTAAVDYIGLAATVDLGVNTVIRLDDLQAISTYPQYGETAVKVLCTSGTYSISYLHKDIPATNLLDASIRLRYFCSYRDSANAENFSRASLYFQNTDSYDSTNRGRIQIPAGHGWNEIEIPFACVAAAGTFDYTANIESMTFAFGTSTSGYEVMQPGEFVIWDYLEIVKSGRSKGAVIIQFDDAVVENFDEMAPYCATKGFPVQVFVMPEMVGKTAVTTTIRYADWNAIIAGYNANVLLGVHGAEAIGTTATDSAIERWCIKQKKPFLDRGLIRGSDYIALPAGQKLSLRDASALIPMRKYFVNIRGVRPFYQEGFPRFEGLDSYGYYPSTPKDHSWSWGVGFNGANAGGGKSYSMTYMDRAAATKSILILFCHGLYERSGGYWIYTRAQYRADIDYLKTLVDAGTLEVITIEDLLTGN